MSGWFVVNVAAAKAFRHEHAGSYVPFEDPEERFPDYGINVHLLEPGQPNAKYHAESVQEDFLVLSGECVAILDGEERRLEAWDFVHCPAGTEHVFVGAGQGPCAILMVGARRPDPTIHYPVNELAGALRRLGRRAHLGARGGVRRLERGADADAASLAAVAGPTGSRYRGPRRSPPRLPPPPR